ncbi:hypothetical protein CCMSSC00406_0009534 [Pleurotus cornucopiae]|uniref:Uncharacterized protein n=1 Tax=Pleurotus cornucopiae TaxID=5321 RepID=A0ACB7IQP5_PLECO|nr:hypothetical protein CCMSSC00406_0009534 [Pleurotus cornucopiae]
MDIAAEEEAIRELQTLRNASSPISKLPTRLIPRIFFLAKLVSIEERFATHRYCAPDSKARNWLNVAGVCRTWRKIVLDAPSLWNNLDLREIRHLDWAKLILARSKGASLQVKCTGSKREHALLSIVLEHISDIQVLNITTDISHFTELQKIIKARTANISLINLRSLNLNNSTYRTTTKLRKALLHAPFLQKLELSGICIPSSIPPLPQLRRLRISSISSGSKNEGMPMTALLSCLLNTPSLEELEVDNALGKVGRKKDRTTVRLPKLSWISLTSDHVANSTLFQHIHYPASARIKFHSTTEPPRGSDIRNLTAIFSHFATSDAAMQINTLFLVYHPTLRRQEEVTLIATSRGVRYLNISCATLERDVLPLTRLSALLPCISIKTLHVGGSPKIKRADWTNLLKLYENTRILEAEDVAPSFLEALLKSPEDEWPPLAEVEEVQLHGCHFDSPYSNPSLTPCIKKLLQERNDLEIPFDVVGISDCYILESTVEELEEHDVRIDWDEETLQKEEEEEEEEEDDDAEYWKERYY